MVSFCSVIRQLLLLHQLRLKGLEFEVALTFDGDWFVKASLQGECSLTFSSVVEALVIGYPGNSSCWCLDYILVNQAVE